MPRPVLASPPGVLRSPVTHRVAIVHTSDPLQAWDFCRGVASYRPRSGIWGLRSIPIDWQASPVALRRLSKTDCDGLIMMPGRWRTLEPLYQRGVKVIDVDGDSRRPAYPSVRLDDVYIGRLAGEHLLERGFARVVYLGTSHRGAALAPTACSGP